MQFNQREPFELEAAWWRPDADQQVAATEPSATVHGAGLEAGTRALDAPFDPLLGASQQQPCHGTLYASPGATFRLRLPGASDRVLPPDVSRFTLHGITASQTPCTLADCLATSVNGALFGGGYRAVELVAHLLVHGAHLDDPRGFRFAEARVQLAGLREVFAARLPVIDGHAGDDPLGGGSMSVQLPGATLAFDRLERRRPGRHTLAIEWDVTATFKLDEPLTYDEWQQRWVTPLLNFVELATREPSDVHDFVAVHREEVEVPPLVRGHISPETMGRTELTFVQPRSSLRQTGPAHDYARLLLGASALQDAFSDALRRWFGLTAELPQPTGLLLSTLSSHMYVTSQLVVLASVAEAYQRRIDSTVPVPDAIDAVVLDAVRAALDGDPHLAHYERVLGYANQHSQRERIQALLQRAGTVVGPLGRKPGRLAQRLVQTRNALVHLPAESRRVLTGLALVEAVDLLVLALQVNLLLDLAIAPSHAALLVKRSYGKQLLWRRLHERDCAWPKGQAQRRD